MFAVAQAPPDHAHRLRTQRNRRTSFCGRRSRCGADLIAAVGDRCPVGATADGSRADDGRCCIPASGPLAGPRGRRCSSVEGAYPNAGGAVPLEDPLTGRRSDSVIGEGPDRGLHPPYREWPAIASGPVTPGEVPPTAHLVTPSRATPNVLIWRAATNRQADFMPALNQRSVCADNKCRSRFGDHR
jgi:hypothetical protein